MEGTIAPEQIIINGQEYSPEDATQLIELGNKWKETESKLNTSLDKVYPEYTRATQRNKELEAKLSEFEKLQSQKAEETRRAEIPTDVQAARKAAREIGLADEDYLKEKGYVRREELDSYFTEKQSQQRQVQDVLEKAGSLEKEIDGSDGRVPFDQKAVLAYASAYQIDDLTDAYDQMNAKANAKWKDEQLSAEERPGLATLRPGGNKEPVAPKYTDGNLGNAISEWLEGIPE